MNFSATTLVIAAHPDDEVLGCGATLARITSEGGTVQTIFLADGESSRFENPELHSRELEKQINSRKAAANSAAEILGCLPPIFLDLPDNKLDSVPMLEICKLIENELKELQPARIITHSSSDLNIDHRIAHEVSLIVSRPISNSLKEVFAFELPSSTEWRPPGSGSIFSPNVFIEVGIFEEIKKNALNSYKSEMREFPHPRSLTSIFAQMSLRGSHSGTSSAEAFQLLRGIY
jgi:LmbE family N-acetylglucosaminyl deacetylase